MRKRTVRTGGWRGVGVISVASVIVDSAGVGDVADIRAPRMGAAGISTMEGRASANTGLTERGGTCWCFQLLCSHRGRMRIRVSKTADAVAGGRGSGGGLGGTILSSNQLQARRVSGHNGHMAQVDSRRTAWVDERVHRNPRR